MIGMLSMIIVTPFVFFHNAQAVGVGDAKDMAICASEAAGILVCMSRLKFTALLSEARVPLHCLRYVATTF